MKSNSTLLLQTKKTCLIESPLFCQIIHDLSPKPLHCFLQVLSGWSGISGGCFRTYCTSPTALCRLVLKPGPGLVLLQNLSIFACTSQLSQYQTNHPPTYPLVFVYSLWMVWNIWRFSSGFTIFPPFRLLLQFKRLDKQTCF